MMPSRAPGRVTPRHNRARRVTYGNVAVKYAAWRRKLCYYSNRDQVAHPNKQMNQSQCSLYCQQYCLFEDLKRHKYLGWTGRWSINQFIFDIMIARCPPIQSSGMPLHTVGTLTVRFVWTACEALHITKGVQFSSAKKNKSRKSFSHHS